MKQLRIFTLVLCFVLVFYFLTLFFSNLSIAEQTSEQKCISSCVSKKQACFNINADKRICEVVYQDCIAACKPEDDSSSTETPAKQEPKNIVPSKAMQPK
jgi:hypothetical protein